ncbi:hypothetical protein AB6E53_02330 [Vibrio breoganii]|uniref:Terminase n=1 Tax=Vibrio breoganii TaxID=553239 RepID=A0AAP8SWK5_9VIBR|nr:hypothetical protein [Vibrio breoganii]PMP10224.1 hypothetical protein BCS93_11150 [Vibrio breoganii]
MPRVNWKHVQQQFENEREKHGLSLRQYCDKYAYSYSTARKHVKVKKEQEQRAEQEQKSEQIGTKTELCLKSTNECDEQPTTIHVETSKPNRPEQFNRSGNPNPANPFRKGNQVARKHGFYSDSLTEEQRQLEEQAGILDVEDELKLCRLQSRSLLDCITHCQNDIKNANSVEERVSLYEQLTRFQALAERSVARIESLIATHSKLRLDVVNEIKTSEDTLRIQQATRKLGYEADKLSKEVGGNSSPLADIYDDIVTKDSSKGMLS